MFTNFLINHFIPNYRNSSDKETRTKVGYLGGIVGLISNIILFLVKITLGILINSISLIADSINNLSDVGSSTITLLGFKLSKKPADKEHPFGHGRTEYIASLIISIIIILVGFELLQSSFDRIRNPVEVTFQLSSIIILMLTILVKLWLAIFNRKLGKMIDSKALIATAVDSISDVFATSIVTLSIILSPIVTFPIDGYMGIIVALIIMYSGFSLVKDTLTPLLGQAPSPELVEKIKESVLRIDGIEGIHDLIVHDYGPNRTMATLHAEVSHRLSPVVAHEIIDAAERKIAEELNVFLVIHTDPLNFDCDLTSEIYQNIKSILSTFPTVISFHDFRIVDDWQPKNMVFEVVAIENLTDLEIVSLNKEIKNRLKQEFQDYEFIISIEREHSYLH